MSLSRRQTVRILRGGCGEETILWANPLDIDFDFVCYSPGIFSERAARVNVNITKGLHSDWLERS